ncbi:hypothetical protein CEXT_598951 [Caerostris extrusa]|uniref:Uncharacterized protein n=1 Tax=Caerostris extrusa TaxID=172846 RepID=A0AAV4YCX6_CAEEX|nr:hypothetical protein CEXT_598951 [Caerostris extrusa]
MLLFRKTSIEELEVKCQERSGPTLCITGHILNLGPQVPPPPGKLSPSVWPTSALSEVTEKQNWSNIFRKRVSENETGQTFAASLDSILYIKNKKKEREIALFNLRGEQASKMNEYEKKLSRLQREVEKCKP